MIRSMNTFKQSSVLKDVPTQTLFLLIGLALILIVLPVEGMQDVCEGETFRTKCRSDEVILVEEAYYGRMRQGRCVKMDMGYLGCVKDVRHFAETRCSGKQNCEISIPDPEFELTQPCYELKSYLEISTICVKVTTARSHVCRSSKFIKVSDSRGFLSSRTSAHTPCGTAKCPWVIEAEPGQKINLTLIDFEAASKKMTASATEKTDVDQNAIAVPDLPNTTNRDIESCRVYMVLREIDSTKSIRVCGRSKRQSHVYKSRSHRLEIYLTPRIQPDDNPLNFLVEYEAIGCPDLTLPERFEILDTSPMLSTVKCIETGDVMKLECRGTKWIGNMKSCVSKQEKPEANQRVSLGPMSMPYGVAVAVVVAVTIVIGMAVLTAGLIYFKRRRQRCKTSAQTKKSRNVCRNPSVKAMAVPTNVNKSESNTVTKTTPIKQKLPPTTTGTAGRKGKYTHIWQMPLPVPGEDSPA